MEITDVDVKTTRDARVYSLTVVTDQLIAATGIGEDEIYIQHLFWNSESDIKAIVDKVAKGYAEEVAERARLAALKATILMGLK